MTEQVFDILSSITKKCYKMHNPKGFFDELMSPFLFLPLLQFSADGGAHSRQGAGFLRLFFYNLFVAEPKDAELDFIEFKYNFTDPRVAENFECDIESLKVDNSEIKSIKENN